MPTLVIDDMPADLLERLTRAAEQHGRSVASEVLTLLAASQPTISDDANEPFGTALNRRVRELGMSEEAWTDLQESLLSARAARHDSIHRLVDFSGPEWDFLEE